MKKKPMENIVNEIKSVYGLSFRLDKTGKRSSEQEHSTENSEHSMGS